MNPNINTERVEKGTPLMEGAAATRPRIWVGCWAAYNAGRLHGRWITVTDTDEIWDAVRAMLAASPAPNAEEWGIFDYEGFEGAEVSEQADFAHVCALAEFIAEHGELGGKLLEHFGQDLNEASAAFEDYAGEHKSLGDFASEFTQECGTEIPESLALTSITTPWAGTWSLAAMSSPLRPVSKRPTFSGRADRPFLTGTAAARALRS